MRTQLVGVTLPSLTTYPTRRLSPLASSRATTDRLPDRRETPERFFDLGRFDAEAADLDLLVGAPEELDRAVGQPACKVAGRVHPTTCDGLERIGNETLGRQLVLTDIPLGDTRAGDEERAGNAGRRRAAASVEDVAGGVADRSTDRHRCRGVLPGPVDDQRAGSNGGLGRPVVIEDAAVAQPAHTRHDVPRACFAAEDEPLPGQHVCIRSREQGVQVRRRDLQHVCGL